MIIWMRKITFQWSDSKNKGGSSTRRAPQASYTYAKTLQACTYIENVTHIFLYLFWQVNKFNHTEKSLQQLTIKCLATSLLATI